MNGQKPKHCVVTSLLHLGGWCRKAMLGVCKGTAKLQALVYDILTCSTMEEGAGKRSLYCANEFDHAVRTNE